MLKKNLKRFLALVAVFAMAITLITVPNASAQADEAASGTYATAGTWWGGGSTMVCYAAEDSTILDLETSKGYWPNGGFPWWSAVIMELNEDGNYVVTEIVPDDGTNDKGAIELTTGRLVICYHDGNEDANSVAFYDSLVVGDVLTYVGLWGGTPDWATLAEGGDVATFSKYVEPVEPECTHEGVVHMDAVEPGCHYNGNVEYWVCYECESFWTDEALTQVTNSKSVILPATGEGNLVHFDAVEPACHYAGNIEYWVCYDCEQVWQDEALTQLTNIKNVVVPAVGGEVVHVEAVEPTATENGNIEYWYCEDCEQVWQDEALTQLTNRMNVIIPATGEEEPELPSIEVGTTATFANGYDWTAQTNQIYIFASEDATATISCFTGQSAGTFGWFHTVILEANGDGTYTVVSSDFAINNGAESVTLGEGKVILMAHDSTSYVDSFNWLKALAAGDVVALDTAWADVAAKSAEAVEVSLGFVVEEEQPCTHEGLVHMDAVEPGCHYDGNIEYWVCYDCETVWQDEALTQITNIKNVVLPATGSENLVYFPAVEPGCHYDGCIEYWYCPDCDQVWQDEALTQLTNHKNVVVPAVGGEVIHVEAVAPTATENGNIEYWYCEECETVWQDEALTQITNFKNVILPATGEEPAFESEATATFANGYDWTAQVNQIYIFASEDATASISSLTGQTPATFDWFHTVVLEANEDGTYTVVASDFGVNTGAIAETLGEGKVILMAHDSTSYVDSFNWLKALAAGDVVTMDTAWADVAAKFAEVVEVSLGFAKEDVPPVVDPELPCEHEGVVHIDAVEPGCHFLGNVEYWVCYECESFWTDEDLTQVTNSKSVILPATGGEVVYMEAVEPGCHSIGNIEHWYCEECEQVWQDEALTQLTNHKNVIVAATGSENIKYVAAVAPTATENGNVEYWYCADCDSYYLDEACTQLANAKRVILPATGEAPVTGDSAPIVVYVVTLMLAASAVVVALKKRFA